jgi:hypothetical protein
MRVPRGGRLVPEPRARKDCSQAPALARYELLGVVSGGVPPLLIRGGTRAMHGDVGAVAGDGCSS